MESFVADALISHLSVNNLFSSAQHGFRSLRSTVTQLVECVDDWSKIIDDRGQVDVIYLDYAKAFDTVSHPKLLHKLEHMGVQGYLLGWIRAFLSARSQAVIINQSFSKFSECIGSVPQGSVLGPILFLVYINDLVSVAKHSTIKQFADDAKLYMRIRNVDDANLLMEDLTAVYRWSQ